MAQIGKRGDYQWRVQVRRMSFPEHYRRRPLDLLRMWHDKIEGWMLEQAGIQFDAEQAKPGLRAVNSSRSE